MKSLVTFICLLSTCLAPFATAGLVIAAKGPEMSVQQIKTGSSRMKALSYHRKIQRTKPAPARVKLLKKNADALRAKLRQSGATFTPDQRWATLISPLNRCTDLVIKTCGPQKQCADSGSCALSVQILELYNEQSNETEKYELENSCIAGLSDNTVFPSCG